jgi:hypothetical protein
VVLVVRNEDRGRSRIHKGKWFVLEGHVGLGTFDVTTWTEATLQLRDARGHVLRSTDVPEHPLVKHPKVYPPHLPTGHCP